MFNYNRLGNLGNLEINLNSKTEFDKNGKVVSSCKKRDSLRQRAYQKAYREKKRLQKKKEWEKLRK